MENTEEKRITDRLHSIGYTECTTTKGRNKASLGERFTPIVLFYAFIIQLLLIFAEKKQPKRVMGRGAGKKN